MDQLRPWEISWVCKFGFVADRKAANDQCIVHGFAVNFQSRFPDSRARKKRKVTELYFNEYDGTAEIYTYSTKLKKRLTAYAAAYPALYQLTEDASNGVLRFEIDKHRMLGSKQVTP